VNLPRCSGEHHRATQPRPPIPANAAIPTQSTRRPPAGRTAEPRPDPDAEHQLNKRCRSPKATRRRRQGLGRRHFGFGMQASIAPLGRDCTQAELTQASRGG